MRTRDIACGLGMGLAFVIAAHAAAIVSAAPQGEVAEVRQVTVKFSESVVAFGDPRLADPFALSCQGAVPAGAGRWASDRVWVYDFREALPPGTKCRALLRPEWKPSVAASGSAAAAALGGLKEFALFHRRPGDRLDAAGRRRRDRGGPALPDPPQRPGRGGERRGQRLLRGRRHRRAPAARAPRRRAARRAAEGASHPPGRVAAHADRALRPAAAPTTRLCAWSGAKASPRRSIRRW